MMKQFLFFALLCPLIPSLSSCALFQTRNSWGEGSNGRHIASAILRQDLVLGMRPTDVRASWGNPQSVESSHYSTQPSEKWTYIYGLNYASGLRDMAEKRIVYFQGGEVVGWETYR